MRALGLRAPSGPAIGLEAGSRGYRPGIPVDQQREIIGRRARGGDIVLRGIDTIIR